MEVPLQMRRSVCCRSVVSDRTQLKIKPFLSLFPSTITNRSSQSSLWRKDCMVARFPVRVSASSDFSKKRPRKVSSPRSKGSTPKGFMPKTSSPRKDHRISGQKEEPTTSTSKENVGSSKKAAEMEAVADEKLNVGIYRPKTVDLESENVIDTIHEMVSEGRKPPTITEISQKVSNGRKSTMEKDVIESGIVTDEKSNAEIHRLKTVELESENVIDTVRGEVSAGRTPLAVVEISLQANNGRRSIMEKGVLESGIAKIVNNDIRDPINVPTLEREQYDLIKNDDAKQIDGNKINENVTMTQILKQESLKEVDMSRKEEKNEEDGTSLKLKLEMEALLLKKDLERLVDVNFLKGIKMFCYPEVVRPDQDIEVFLNRSLSTLNKESNVMIMGAFNDWRYKSFTIKLNKTQLSGDWWSCQVHVPKEAYKIDFVFFNGEDVYENNDTKDFCINVEGGIDEYEFENFLLEEKHRELEKLAREQAEREKQAEEQRRIEAEKAANEADRSQARGEAERRKGILQELIKKAVNSVDNLWFIEPSDFKGEDAVRLYYNRSSGPLANAKEIWIHGGYNNWKDGLSIVAKLVSFERVDGDWWYTDVIVPDRSLVLDWVFADGPPQQASLYDNNQRRDFHAIVPKSVPEDVYWVEEENEIYSKLQAERRIREEAIRAKAERTARMKAETKERTMKTYLLSQKHIVYTEPLDVQAGSTVTVLFNPASTVLNGKPEIWFRCSFNRWTHRMGPLPPRKMLPADNGSLVRTTVKVPLDAYVMDFVFSEKEDGGIFDNKYGMDYHIPVFGGVAKEPPMHIVHIAVEMAPIAKVGGLGDVVTSLSRAIIDLNHNVDIILPKYDCLNLGNVKDFNFHKGYSWGGTEIKVWLGKVEGVPVYFLEPQNGFFWTGCIYGCRNDGERFGFFCHAALEFLLQSGSHPDVIHCHDWSSAPVAWLFKDHYMHYGLSKARIVFTIHNLEFGAPLIGKAMAYADKATTVSPTYSQEVSANPAIAPHLYKFHGILNGIDPDIWDPYNDKFIPKLVERLRMRARRYVALHLRYEKDMLSFTGCTYGLTDSESEELRLMRENTNHWKIKSINSTEQRLAGLCPLTPKEVGVFLQALGYPPSTLIYIAAGEIYGGKARLSELTSRFPNVVFKETIASEEELKYYSNHASQTAALDYIISVESDIFIPSYTGNMARVVEGHRRFLGHRKTISPDRRGLVEIFHKLETGTLKVEPSLPYLVKQLHKNRQGAPRKRAGAPAGIKGRARFRSEESFYQNPYPECICASKSTSR